MQVMTRQYTQFLRPQGQQPDPPPPEKLDKAVLTGQIVGGTVAGLGLGYLGMDLGMRLGMESGMRAVGGGPVVQILGLFTVGIARGVLAAGIGGGLGAAAGIGLGGYLGGKVGGHFSN